MLEQKAPLAVPPNPLRQSLIQHLLASKLCAGVLHNPISTGLPIPGSLAGFARFFPDGFGPTFRSLDFLVSKLLPKILYIWKNPSAKKDALMTTDRAVVQLHPATQLLATLASTPNLPCAFARSAGY